MTKSEKDLLKQHFDISGVKFKKIWLPSFINALFTVLCPNTIFINKKDSNVKFIAHELTHREQYKEYGLLVYFMGKTWCNLIQFFGSMGVFEKEAYAIQDLIDMEQKGI